MRNLLYYLSVGAVIFLLKWSYSVAGTGDLQVLIRPVAALVSLITGAGGEYGDSGVYYEQLNIVIDKSCSGFNFLILCYGMLAVLAIPSLNGTRAKMLAVILPLPGAWLLTVLVNSARILSAYFVHQLSGAFWEHPAIWLHQAIGAFIYLFFLMLIYAGADFLIHKLTRGHAKSA
ncbi:MAG TPA: exosortase K [Flavilitoribacter sp.]|nr:exosortase K [Flavilitoribacter sp.]HMQ86471.1 exosortase K [Flavilitoribacter sp.]